MPAQVIITEPARNVVEINPTGSSVWVSENHSSVSVNATTISGGSGSGTGGNTTSTMVITNSIGDAVLGETYASGTGLETIIRDILSPYLEPTFETVLPIATGVYEISGEDLILECGLEGNLTGFSILWGHPESLYNGQNIVIKDITPYTVPTLANEDIVNYANLSTPYIVTAAYTIPAWASPFTRTFEITSAYLSEDGLGSPVTFTTTVKAYTRHRAYVVSGPYTPQPTLGNFITVSDPVYSGLEVDTSSSVQSISAACNASTADSSNFTYILVPLASGGGGALTTVAATVGGVGVADYTESFQDMGGIFTGEVGTASPQYKIYKSKQSGAFDSDVALNLIINY